MKLFLITAWIGLTAALPATPKFAVVKVTDIYRGLPSTAAMQKNIQAQQEEILKNKRAESLRTILAEMEALQGQLSANKDDLESELGKSLIRSYEIKRQEAETLRKEFEEYRAEEEKRLNKALVTATRASLNKISAAAQQIAKERNFDGVFDTSGNTNTGLPFVLYAKDAEDISEDVIALLAEKPAESAAPTGEAAPAQDTPPTE